MEEKNKMTFTALIRKEADACWEASFDHPFVKGIGNGTLSLEKFKYYVLQDAYYLHNFAKCQAYASAMAPDLATTASLADHAKGTYEAELALHRDFSKRLGVTEAEKENFKPAPTAYAYTSHMYRAVLTGNLGDVIAALLPCYWLYYEVGERLQAYQPEEKIYQEWIATYGGDWFRTLVEAQINRLDELAKRATDDELKRWKEHFIISSRYELAFWEMAWTLEDWEV